MFLTSLTKVLRKSKMPDAKSSAYPLRSVAENHLFMAMWLKMTIMCTADARCVQSEGA